jgi:flagellin-specific chaperone FliS
MYDEKIAREIAREEGMEDGMEMGIEMGMEKVTEIVVLLKNGLAPEKIAEEINVPLARVYEWKALLFETA